MKAPSLGSSEPIVAHLQACRAGSSGLAVPSSPWLPAVAGYGVFRVPLLVTVGEGLQW